MKVLFVCTANTCRSPMLRTIFQSKAKARGIDIDVESAGIYADGEDINRFAKSTLERHGLKVEKHFSKACDKTMADECDFIFATTDAQAQKLIEKFGCEEKVVALSKLCGSDIDDPYGRGIDAYEKTYFVLDKVADSIIDFIQK